jgi:hypothetical protein
MLSISDFIPCFARDDKAAKGRKPLVLLAYELSS